MNVRIHVYNDSTRNLKIPSQETNAQMPQMRLGFADMIDRHMKNNTWLINDEAVAGDDEPEHESSRIP